MSELIFWMPTDDEICGNTYFKHPNAKQAIDNIYKITGCNYLIEPNYGSTGTCMYVRSVEQAEWLNPRSTKIPRADGLCVTLKFMKENKIGLFMRTSDCLALCITTENAVRILHVSVESLNNGILMNLPLDSGSAYAVLGPSICSEHLTYDLNDKDESFDNYLKFVNRTSNYEVLGYNKFITIDEEKNVAHVDIKGIVKSELEKAGVEILHESEECTVCNELGSHRLANCKANTMVVYTRNE